MIPRLVVPLSVSPDLLTPARLPVGEHREQRVARRCHVGVGQTAAHAAEPAGVLHVRRHQLGDLDKVQRVAKLLVMVACDPEFDQQPAVGNGASDLLVELYGESGRHARSAVGMAALPRGAPVEVEMILEVAD